MTLAAATPRWARRTGGFTVAWEAVNPGLSGALCAAGARRTPTFTVSASGELIVHRLAAAEIDDDLGDRVVAELLRPGLVAGDAFEGVFAGVVASTAASVDGAWDRFHDQSLARLRTLIAAGARGEHGALETFAGIYRHALSLIDGGSLLDAGTCFGFLCLLAAERGLRVHGTDASRGTLAIARRAADRAAAEVRFTVADVRAPAPVRADTVSALHLLEHLAPDDAVRALAELCAAARCRVIVAVPLERRADPAYGHRGAFDLARLAALGARVPGWRSEVTEFRGGWLVLDRD